MATEQRKQVNWSNLASEILKKQNEYSKEISDMILEAQAKRKKDQNMTFLK